MSDKNTIKKSKTVTDNIRRLRGIITTEITSDEIQNEISKIRKEKK
ncbi:MAG: hypothetical protein ACTSW1_14905 [Candidatus Hodarchaeales archaeon]